VFGDSDSGTDEAASDNNPAEHMQVRQGPLEPTSLAGLTTRYGHQAGQRECRAYQDEECGGVLPTRVRDCFDHSATIARATSEVDYFKSKSRFAAPATLQHGG
jgi:hypothetical protein